MANVVALTLPVPTLATIGLESNVSPNQIGVVAMTMPTPQLVVIGGAGVSGDMSQLALPVPTLAIAGVTPVAASVSMNMPAPTLTAKGFTAGVATVLLALPTPTLQISGPNAVLMNLLVPQLAAAGNTGLVGRVTLNLPVPQIAVGGLQPFAGGMPLTLPTPQLAVAGVTGSLARMQLMLAQLALAAQGVTGVVGEVTLNLPVPQLTAEGHGPFLGNVSLTLPMLILQQTGYTSSVTPAEPDGNVLPAITMHSETGALTQYTNFPFNSMAAFNGMYLAASAEGLFMLGGDQDNGAIIQAAARVGITDFGTSFLKRVDRSYVGYRTDGNLVVRVYTDEVDQRDYLLAATGRLGLHGNHFRIGKGLRARYWQFEIMNQNGADFTLNSIELKPTQLRRRIGGGDA